jgi:hypothetical protein
MNPIHIHKPYFPKIHLNVVLPEKSEFSEKYTAIISELNAVVVALETTHKPRTECIKMRSNRQAISRGLSE